MYNQSIITAPIALFLGAGASKPFGKMLMGEFIDYLEKQDQFKHATLLRDIIRVPDGRDLEHLLEELEEWSRKSYHVEDDKTLLRPRGDLAAVGESSVQRHARNATTITRALRREVFCAYRDIPATNRKKLVKCFDVLFEVLLKGVDTAKNPLVVFTTNYDPAIETFCQAKGGEFRLCDGFVSRGWRIRADVLCRHVCAPHAAKASVHFARDPVHRQQRSVPQEIRPPTRPRPIPGLPHQPSRRQMHLVK